MNLIQGQVLPQKQAIAMLDELPFLIHQTLTTLTLSTEDVIEACDTLSQRINESDHLSFLIALGLGNEKAKAELATVKMMLSKEYLRKRIEIEFAGAFDLVSEFQPYGADYMVEHRYVPLGVLLHIAASNASGLPIYSIIEGLLTRNINLLKLAGGMDDITILFLRELIQIQPLLASYLYVFDISSSDVSSMKKLANVADGILLWGGDQAISAVRALAPPNTKLMEWGHKISFAYITKQGLEKQQLIDLADHICDSEQLLCNSCQGIYYDTQSKEELEAFASDFSIILSQSSIKYQQTLTTAQRAQLSLQLYTAMLEAVQTNHQIFVSNATSVIVMQENSLEESMKFRNCWIKPLPKENIVSVLKPNKGYLQTVALLCSEEERELLQNLLLRSGVTRITQGKRMTQAYCGMSHDGRMALLEYMKIVSIG